MNKVLWGLAFFLVLTKVVNSANREQMTEPRGIKGVVYDSKSKQPVEYATVAIFISENDSLVTGTITDENGFFKINEIQEGIYRIEITFIGYSTKVIEGFQINDTRKVFDVGTVNLVSVSETMDEFVVVADRPTMSYQIDKKVINVSQQHTSSSGTAVEVLENIPSVSVSVEGDVTLRGSSSFTVLIDGKPSILDANDVLNQIPASQIERIEIITNPSAKFDPDGVAGIINIIMKKNRLQGISLVANVNGGSFGRYGGDFLLNFRKNSINAFVGADYNKRILPGESRRLDETYKEDTASLYSIGDFLRNRNSWNIRAGIDINLNPKSNFSIGYRLGERFRGEESDMTFEEWSSALPLNKTQFVANEVGGRGGFSHNLTVDYIYNFDKDKNHTLLAQAILSGGNSEDASQNLLSDVASNIISGQKSIEKGPEKEAAFKLDYSMPLGKLFKFEAGYQGSIDISDESNDLFFYNIATEVFDLQNQYTMSVNYSTNVHALYTIFSSEQDKLGYQLGLRSEYTDRLVDLKDDPRAFSLERLDFYPTVHVSYKLPAQQEAMASYTRRLQRLRGWYLEPFYTWDDAYNVRIGNPNLIPEFIDSYELNYQKKYSKNALSCDIYYRITHNKIERIQSVYQDSNNIFLSTFDNVGKDYSLGTEIMTGFDPTKWWHFDIMGNIFDYRQEGLINGKTYTASSFNWNTRLNNTFKLTRLTVLQLMAMYNSPSVTAQGKMEGYFVFNIALKQDILKNKASFTLNVRDVLGTRKHESIVSDTGFYSFRTSYSKAPVISLTLSLKLNNYRTERKDGNRVGSKDAEDSGGEGDQ